MTDKNSRNYITRKTKSVLVAVLLVSSLFVIIFPQKSFAGIDFGSAVTLEGTATDARNPQIVVSGSLVWAVWAENTGSNTKIMLKVSTDGGQTFGSATDLSQNSPAISFACLTPFTDFDCRGFPQIAASGNDAFLVWQDDNDGDDNADGTATGDGDVYYRKISYDGVSTFTFTPLLTSAPAIVSANVDLEYVLNPIVAATGSFVHVVWIGPEGLGDNVLYRRSTNTGAGFTEAQKILSSSTPDTLAQNTDIALDGTDVYVVWEDYLDTTTSTAEILFQRSSDSGATFLGTPVNVVHNDLTIPSPDADDSLNPQVAAGGGMAFIVWQDADPGTIEVFYRRFIESSGLFDPAIASAPDQLSAALANSINPQVAAKSDGSVVYTTWEEDAADDILFERSINSGDTFPDPSTTISSGPAAFPKMDASGNNVYIAWIHTLSGPTEATIRFASSANSGTDFTGFQEVSATGDGRDSGSHQVDSASAHVIWADTLAGPQKNILIRSGNFGAATIDWDKADYRLSDTAIITLTSNIGLGTISVTVTSSADGTGFSRVLTEGTPGTYTGTITFTEGSSVPASGILKVALGGTITVTKASTSDNANIYPRTLLFEFTINYAKGAGGAGAAAVRFDVTDQHSNLNPAVVEDIVVTVSSANTGDSISLTARETGVDTGLFKNDNLIFTTGDNSVPVGSSITVSQVETNGALLTGAIDTINVAVKSTTFSGGFNLPLTETTATSGDFRGTLALSLTGPSSGNNLQVSAGDIFSMTYGGETENALVTPNSNPRVGALKSAVGDTVTATWQTASDNVNIVVAGGAGGGAGGLVRPGLVLNVLASLAGGGGADASPPKFASSSFQQKDSFGNPIVQDPFKPILPSTSTTTTYPLTINGKGYGISSYANTILTNEVQSSETIKMDLVFFESSSLEHVALNFAQGDEFSDVSPTITFDKGQLQVHDPKGFFGNDLKATITKDGTKYVLHYDIKLIKLGEYNLVVRVWDDKRNTAETKVFDAFKVVEATQEISPTEDTQNVGIDENLISENIAPPIQREDVDRLMPIIEKWGGYSSESVSDAALLESMEIEGEYIPVWFKEMSGWVVKGDISPQEFVDAIRYLVEKGIIK